MLRGMLHLEQLAELAHQHAPALSARVAEFSIAGRHVPFNARAQVMGGVTLSAGSWYRESVCLDADAAVQRAQVLRAQGADMVDLGAESTLAHTDRMDAAAQCSVLEPILHRICPLGIPVSVETYLPEVAHGALKAGAAVINLTGMAQSKQVYALAAEHEAAVILCYVEGANPREAGALALADDPIPRMMAYFEREIAIAQREGLNRLILDPGLGFYYSNLQDGAQRVRRQVQVFLNSFRLRELGWPVCHALPHAFEYFREEVRSAEAFFAVLALLGRTDLLRTHEVPQIRAVLDTLCACNKV